MNPFRFAQCTIGLLIGLASLQPPLSAQNAPSTSAVKNVPCGGLHAGIHWEHGLDFTFVLLNDSDEVLDTSKASWRLVIDGKELVGEIFREGPVPAGGWNTRNPGESYELGTRLSNEPNLLATGVHKLSWKGPGFQSPTITVTIP
jgi:hypothetical protein